MSVLTVLDAPGLVTVQDAGRPGHAHLGVPRAGFLDPPEARFANRLVGNHADAAVLEVTAAGLRVRCDVDRWVAVTGARCTVHTGGTARAHGRAERLRAGEELRLGPALDGVRSYLAIAGGIDVEPVLGSRATDTLAWVGPPRVDTGAVLRLGPASGPPAAVDLRAPVRPGPLRVDPGPRIDRFEPGTWARLLGTGWTVTPASNRVGLRLDGVPLVRHDHGELASEGMVLGAVQVPPDGRPVVFLADHPTTGGYPVVAVVRADDVARCAQLRPGDEVRFAQVRGPVRGPVRGS